MPAQNVIDLVFVTQFDNLNGAMYGRLLLLTVHIRNAFDSVILLVSHIQYLYFIFSLYEARKKLNKTLIRRDKTTCFLGFFAYDSVQNVAIQRGTHKNVQHMFSVYIVLNVRCTGRGACTEYSV